MQVVVLEAEHRPSSFSNSLVLTSFKYLTQGQTTKDFFATLLGITLKGSQECGALGTSDSTLSNSLLPEFAEVHIAKLIRNPSLKVISSSEIQELSELNSQ